MADAPKKARVNGKRKGNSFEGHIARTLTSVLAPLNFRRSQSSGAILGGLNAKLAEQFSEDAKALFIGDVVPTNEADIARDLGWRFKFTLECKFYKDCDHLDHLFHNTKLKGWMEQAITDSLKLKKKPLLIFKFNRTETYCAIPRKFYASVLEIIPETVTRHVIIKFPPDEFSDKNMMHNGLEMVIFMLDEALRDIDWWKTAAIDAKVVEEQPPSGTLCDPKVMAKAFDAVMRDAPGYMKKDNVIDPQ